MASAPGTAATRKTLRSFDADGEQRVATSGPTSAPALSIAWWKP